MIINLFYLIFRNLITKILFYRGVFIHWSLHSRQLVILFINDIGIIIILILIILIIIIVIFLSLYIILINLYIWHTLVREI